MTIPTTCTACQAPRLPGHTTCEHCGERWPVIDWAAELPLPTDPLPDAFPKPTVGWQVISRAVSEARGLEYAGDVGAAIAIYERLILTRTTDPTPYRRLAILHRRGKRPADEERVVRLALAHIPTQPDSWFVLRLAKMVASKKPPR